MEQMAWAWMGITMILIWMVSLCRVTFSTQLWPSKVLTFSHVSGQGTKRENVLLVIAHPDDESMFFSPTILFLVSEGYNLHILCMSTGNADGKGNIRTEELYRACAILRIPLQQIKILDHPKLQDGFNEPWDHELLATIIAEEIKAHEINIIITFDRYGISGHPNHRDVHYGLCMCLRGKSQKPEAWEIISRSILCKYSGPFDVWLSICLSLCDRQGRTCCLLNSHPYKSYRAMAEHESQWVWCGGSSARFVGAERRFSVASLPGRVFTWHVVPEAVCTVLQLHLCEHP